MRKRVLAVLCGILLVLVFTACTNTTASSGSSTTNQGTMPGMDMGTATATPGSDAMTASLQGLSGKDFEVKFMQYMIVHHQSAIDMAKLMPTHTQRVELNTLSQNIIAAQNKEVDQMTTWLAQWYNEKPLADSMSVPGMMDMMGEMTTLNNAKDAAFDRQFLTMMAAHHQQAVSMAKLIPDRTQRPELIKLGQDVVNTQSAEIQQMQRWQQEWFKS